MKSRTTANHFILRLLLSHSPVKIWGNQVREYLQPRLVRDPGLCRVYDSMHAMLEQWNAVWLYSSVSYKFKVIDILCFLYSIWGGLCSTVKWVLVTSILCCTIQGNLIRIKMGTVEHEVNSSQFCEYVTLKLRSQLQWLPCSIVFPNYM